MTAADRAPQRLAAQKAADRARWRVALPSVAALVVLTAATLWVVSPVLLNVHGSVTGSYTPIAGPSAASAIPWRILAGSLASALGAALVATLLCLPMAAALARDSGRRRGTFPFARAALIGLSVAVVVTPAFVLAQGVVSLADLLGEPSLFVPVFFAGVPQEPWTGAVGVALVGGMTGWPIAGALLVLAFRTRPPEALDVARTLPRSRSLRARVACRWTLDGARVLPFVLAGAGLVAMRTLLDSAAPALLGQRAFATEIWFGYSMAGGASMPALKMTLALVAAMLPLLLPLTIVLTRQLGGMRVAAGQGRKATAGVGAGLARGVRREVWWGVVLLLTFGLPIVALALAPRAAIPWGEIATSYGPVFAGSVGLGLTVGLTAAALSLAAAWALDCARQVRGTRAFRWAFWIAAALAFVWPPHAAAAGWVSVRLPLDAAPVWWADRFDEARVVIVLVARYALLGAAIAMWFRRGVDPSEREAARVMGIGGVRGWWLVDGARQWRAFLGIAAIVTVLAATDREVSQMLALPGTDTITLAAFRMLHYGADSLVLGLVLLATAMTVALAVIAALTLTWAGRAAAATRKGRG